MQIKARFYNRFFLNTLAHLIAIIGYLRPFKCTQYVALPLRVITIYANYLVYNILANIEEFIVNKCRFKQSKYLHGTGVVFCTIYLENPTGPLKISYWEKCTLTTGEEKLTKVLLKNLNGYFKNACFQFWINCVWKILSASSLAHM